MARAASRDIYGAVGRRGEGAELMRRDHLWEIEGCRQWITEIEKMLWRRGGGGGEVWG